MASRKTRWAWLAGAVLLGATLASCQSQPTQGVVAQQAAPVFPASRAAVPATTPAGHGDAQVDQAVTVASTTMPASQGASGSYWGQADAGTNRMLWQMLAYVLVILVLGGLTLFVIRRVMPRLGISTGKSITVLETAYLGPRKTLHLVKVGRRQYLIAASHERLGEPVDVTEALEGGGKTFAQAIEAAQAEQGHAEGKKP